MFTELFPILSSRDLDRLVAFYQQACDAQLVYRFPEEGPAGYASLQIGKSSFGIGSDPSAPETPSRGALWLYAETCEDGFDALVSAGAAIVSPPTDMPWGERVADVTDPDGNLIHVGQRPEPAEDPEPTELQGHPT
ncbi:VOC family protein [Williamsia muralis]|uniref:VOC family protein n=1 Tax=Williamsia marianensis TaxID=85044 RepID=UPI0038009703